MLKSLLCIIVHFWKTHLNPWVEQTNQNKSQHWTLSYRMNWHLKANRFALVLEVKCTGVGLKSFLADRWLLWQQSACEQQILSDNKMKQRLILCCSYRFESLCWQTFLIGLTFFFLPLFGLSIFIPPPPILPDFWHFICVPECLSLLPFLLSFSLSASFHLFSIYRSGS